MHFFQGGVFDEAANLTFSKLGDAENITVIYKRLKNFFYFVDPPLNCRNVWLPTPLCRRHCDLRFVNEAWQHQVCKQATTTVLPQSQWA